MHVEFVWHKPPRILFTKINMLQKVSPGFSAFTVAFTKRDAGKNGETSLSCVEIFPKQSEVLMPDLKPVIN